MIIFYISCRLRALDALQRHKPAETGLNVLGIILGASLSQGDWAAFMHKYRSDTTDGTFTDVQINDGVYDPRNSTEEVSVNDQYGAVMTFPTALIFYSTSRGPKGTHDWFIS
jgi:hypothetical protein